MVGERTSGSSIRADSSVLSLTHNKTAVGSVTVTKNLRILIDDTKKNLKGYNLTMASNLTGVPVVLLSTLTWVPTGTRAPSPGYRSPAKNLRAELTKKLGKRHSIIQLLATFDKTKKLFKHEHVDAMKHFARRAGILADRKAEKILEDVYDTYPVLRTDGIEALWQSNRYGGDREKVTRLDWLNYVILVDNAQRAITLQTKAA